MRTVDETTTTTGNHVVPVQGGAPLGRAARAGLPTIPLPRAAGQLAPRSIPTPRGAEPVRAAGEAALAALGLTGRCLVLSAAEGLATG